MITWQTANQGTKPKVTIINSLLLGVTSMHLSKLGQVQKVAVRLVMQSFRYSHILLLFCLTYTDQRSSMEKASNLLFPFLKVYMDCIFPWTYLYGLAQFKDKSHYNLQSKVRKDWSDFNRQIGEMRQLSKDFFIFWVF